MARRIVPPLAVLVFISCQPDGPARPGENRPPTARIDGAHPTQEGTILTFDALGSTDPDGDTLTYAWELGDGATRETAVVHHGYRDEGSYRLQLIVSDSRGGRDTVRTTIQVANAAPIITTLVTPSLPLVIGSPATVQVAFFDPGPADTLVGSIDWGDQSSSLVTGANVSHTYAAVGNYVITATVRDNDGAVTEQAASSSIEIINIPANRPPMAMIEGPAKIREGGVAMFSAQLSSDPEGTPLQYHWDFGIDPGPYDHLVEQGRVYYDDGAYIIELIVTDAVGAKDTARRTLVVENTPPMVSVFPPSQQAVGARATTRIAVADSGHNDKHTIAISWGDGTRDSIASGSEPWNNLVSHTYSQPGLHRIEATVRDEDGGVTTAAAPRSVIVFDATQRRSIAGYEAFDLGTLGGNSARPRDFNDYGQVVGSSATAAGQTHAFVWDNGTLRDLGTLGREGSEAQRINNAGQIAGSVWGNDNPRSLIAATWQNGVGRILDGVREEYGVRAAAINESGDIAWAAHGHENNFAWLWRNGWQRLGALTGPFAPSGANAMNERGQIVGTSAAVHTGEWPGANGHATLWENGAMSDLGLLGFNPCRTYPDRNCGYSGATGINESGQTVGFSTDTEGSWHIVLWEGGTVRDIWRLPPENPYYGQWAVINDAGQIAGSGRGEAFFWSDGIAYPLGSLGGGATEVVDMNEAGAVVGISKTANGEQHVFVWSRDRGMTDLGTGPHGFNAAWVVGISYRGDIVGFASPCDPRYKDFCHPTESRAIMWRKP